MKEEEESEKEKKEELKKEELKEDWKKRKGIYVIIMYVIMAPSSSYIWLYYRGFVILRLFQKS